MLQGPVSYLCRKWLVLQEGCVRITVVWLLIGLLSGGGAHASECHPGERQTNQNVYWGDLHVHTAYSMDSYVFGNLRTPEDAYAFARGEATATPTGEAVKLDRPLDFAAVTDHAEYFGLLNVCRQQGDEQAYCQDLAEAAGEGTRRGFNELFLPILLAGDKHCLVEEGECPVFERDLWGKVIKAAEEANDPCNFTAFVANEWTASPGHLHWHRNLIYASAKVPDLPINSIDQPLQEDLWAALDRSCGQVEGCDVLAIPHNSNLSMGGSFTLSDNGASNQARARFEKLLEIHQHKGNSECYPGSVLSDEDCAFEQMLPIPLLQELAEEPREITDEEHRQIAGGYARDVLAKGLETQAASGTNPFAYGFVGSTDTHAARPGYVSEQGWTGHFGAMDSDPASRPPLYNPGGIVGVWAEENTRSAIFAALARKETFATSGPRIRLRFDQTFGAYASCERTVGEVSPMGSTVPGSSARPPAFIVRAMQDQRPLARVDIVKLYLRDDRLQQAVYSFAGDAEGKADWCVAWRDEDYRANEYALWYARVLEVPSMRWDGKTQIRERAWSSPIWSVP